jgi:hypothetical protein
MQKLLAVSAAAAALLAFNGGAAQSAEIKVGTFASAKSFTVRDMYIPWIAKVEKESGGAVKFKQFWGGALIRSPRKQYEGLLNGIQDASPLLPSYTHKLFAVFVSRRRRSFQRRLENVPSGASARPGQSFRGRHLDQRQWRHAFQQEAECDQ